MEETAAKVFYLGLVNLFSTGVTFLVYKPSVESPLSQLGEMTVFYLVLAVSLAILGFLAAFVRNELEDFFWAIEREQFEGKAAELGYTAAQLDLASSTIRIHLRRNPGSTTDELLGRVNNPLFGYNDETVEAFKLAGFTNYEGYGQDSETGQWYTTEANDGVKRQKKEFQKETKLNVTKLLANKLLRR